MHNNWASHYILITVSVFFSFLIFSADYSVAQMPSYEMLDDIQDILMDPLTLSVDSNENLYTVEHNKKRLVVFDKNGVRIHHSSFADKPRAVEVDDTGRIYIGFSDYNNTYGYVKVYQIDSYNMRQELFYLGAASGEFTRPGDIAVDNNTGNIFVADYVNSIVKVFNIANPDVLLYLFDGSDANDNVGGQLVDPSSIFINDAQGEILVLDHPEVTVNDRTINGARIQIFDMSGNYLNAYDMYDNDLPEGSLIRPYHLSLDTMGRMYVSDSVMGVVNVYEGNSDYLGFIQGNLSNLMDVVISKSNVLYLTETGRSTIKRFTLSSPDVPSSLPIADFTGSPLNGTAPLMVNFTNLSTGSEQPLTYEWDFDIDGITDSTDEHPTHIYTEPGMYSVSLTALDAQNNNTLTIISYITVSGGYELTVSREGGGAGRVKSISEEIDCNDDCSEIYPEASTVTLKAVAYAGSLFTGWSGGGCSGLGECVTFINAQTTVTATFDTCSYLPVRIRGDIPAYYSTIDAAYDNAVNNDIIETQNILFTSIPEMNESKIVSLVGGYACDYSSIIGQTLVSGPAAINSGTVSVSGFIFE